MAILRTLLRRVSLLVSLLIFSAHCQAVEIPHLIDSYDLTGNTSAAAGSIYTLGAAGTLRFGSPDDESNMNTEGSFNYTADLAPANPDDPNTSIKHADNWGGGLLVHLSERGSLGVDLDGLVDNFDAISTNGEKLTLGFDPYKIWYRFAKTSIDTSLGKIQGALIYQNTFGGSIDFKPDELATITVEGSASIFNPPAPQFDTTLSAAALATFSNFQSTLQSFELWKFGGEWSMLWSDLIDTTLSGYLSHEIITASSLIDITTALGIQLNPRFHAQVGWEYSHDTIETLNTFSLEARWTWDHTEGEPKGSPVKRTAAPSKAAAPD